MNLRVFLITFLLAGMMAWSQEDSGKGKTQGGKADDAQKTKNKRDDDHDKDKDKDSDKDKDEDKDKDKDDKGKKKPPKGQSVLVQVITNDQDPVSGSPGEQALIQHLFLVDLSRQKVLASLSLGSSVQVVLSDDRKSVWVIQRLASAQQTRVRQLALSNFATLVDHTFPVVLDSPSDPAGDSLANQRSAQFSAGQLAIVGVDPASTDKSLALLNLSFCSTAPTFRKLVSLQPQQQAFSDVFNLSAASGMILFPSGDALSITELPDPSLPGCVMLTSAPAPGITPVVLDPATGEGVRLAAYNGRIDRIVAVTSAGLLIQRAPSVQINASQTATDASFPLELSVEPAGTVAAIRFKTDPTINANAVALVNLGLAQQITTVDLPSEGAIAQLDGTHTLFADGADLKELNIADIVNPTMTKLMSLTGVSVHRVLRLIPVPK